MQIYKFSQQPVITVYDYSKTHNLIKVFFLHWEFFSSEVKQCNLSVGCKNCRAQSPLRGPKGIRGVFLSITLHDHINIRRLKIKVPIRAKILYIITFYAYFLLPRNHFMLVL